MDKAYIFKRIIRTHIKREEKLIGSIGVVELTSCGEPIGMLSVGGDYHFVIPVSLQM